MSDKSVPGWIETSATVVTCHYQFARMNTLTMGLQSGKQFRISFEYYAHGQLYNGEFNSSVAIAQDEHIPVQYNPLRPEQNSYSMGPDSPVQGKLIAVGIVGSVLSSLLWLLLLRSCS